MRATPPATDRMRVGFLLNGDDTPKIAFKSQDEEVPHTPVSIMWTSNADSGGRHERRIGMDVKCGRRKGGIAKTAKRFLCGICGFAFGMRSNLKRHIMTVHEHRRGFRCTSCDAAFGLKQNLATHVRVKHDKSRPFECDICGFRFGYKQVLQNHRRNIHGMS